MDKAKRHIRRIGIGITGGIVVIIGIIAIPYPGPGWLIVFAGLAILATEFVWAQRLLNYAKGYYDRWKVWLERQPLIVRIIVLLVTVTVVVMTLWLLNMFGLIAAWFHLPFLEGLRSPVFH